VLIRQLAQENLSWGNHREMIAALDFFTVPMVTFKLLYCFFVVEHGRRQILHFNVTRHPTAEWVIQQLREAFPEVGKLRYIILDRDAKFNADVLAFLKATGLKPKRTSIQSPWQNGVAERWVGGCRRELLDHVIPLNEDHLRRLVREYISYFHEDRIHDSLTKDTLNRRQFKTNRVRKRRLFPARAWAVSTIVTPGGKQHSVAAALSKEPASVCSH
jgi:putative transposase